MGTEHAHLYVSDDHRFRVSVVKAPAGGKYFLTLCHPTEPVWSRVPLKPDTFENVERMLLAADYPVLINRRRRRLLLLLLDDDT